MKSLFNYEIKINFSTDKVLNADQLANLESAIFLQINEPVDHNQNDEDFETYFIRYEINGGK